MTAVELSNHLENRAGEVAALKKLWAALLPVEPPSDYQFNLWLDLHRFETMVYSIRETARVCQRLGGEMSAEHSVRFVSKVGNTKEERSKS